MSPSFLAPDDRNLHVRRILNHAGEETGIGMGFLQHTTGGDYRGVFPEYGALLLLRGEGIYRDDRGNELAIKAGAFIQRLPDRWHETTVRQDGQWLECYLTFGNPLYRALTSMRVIDPTRPVLWPGVRPDIVDTISRSIEQLRSAADNDLPLLVPKVIELAAVLTWEGAKNRRDEEGEYVRAIEQVAVKLSNNFDRTLPLPELLRDVPLSYERFRKLFKEQMGLSPGEYRIRRRLEHAAELLHDSRLRIYQIAHQLGYPDAFSFSKQFTRFTGKSPRQYRREMIGDGGSG